MHQGNTTFTTDEIEVYIRTYRSLLKSTGTTKISKLIYHHEKIDSMLHQNAARVELDIAAFIYVLLRLPPCMSQVKKVILGQSYSVFKKNGYGVIGSWQEVEAPGRRRKMYFNGRDTLAVYIASVTDVDDLVTLLTAFQIEWNKFHKKITRSSNVLVSAQKILPEEDRNKIEKIWGVEYHKFLTAIKHREIDFDLDLLSGSYVEYAKATQQWWDQIETSLAHLNLSNRPVYFVSSNTHSLVNLVTRWVMPYEKQLIEYLYTSRDETLINIWKEMEQGERGLHKEYFLYYIAKKALKTDKDLVSLKIAAEKRLGIGTIPASHYLDIDTQVIEVSSLARRDLANTKVLAKSNAVIINIDYPLGWAAYQVLTEIGQNVEMIRGVYIVGKAATLNGQIGDILLPGTVFDQHTKNIYAISNCFTSSDFRDIFQNGAVLENQKTICTKGTFLESEKLIEKWYKEGYTIIEMESGPYLNAAYEFVYYNRYTENAFVNLTSTPFELGIIHYASDTPYSKAKNLGVRNLSYEGVESTYAGTQAILNRIIKQEISHLR